MPDLAEQLQATLIRQALMLATAESCTGGMLAAALTDLPGASLVFERGFVTYSNEAKVQMLGVPPITLQTCGAVSAETARDMAAGALANSRAQFAIATTGIAGPGGGSKEKPVGTVYISCGRSGGLIHAGRFDFTGDRAAIRRQTVEAALSEALRYLDV